MYVPIKQMNDDVVDLRTPSELEKHPYPDNVRLGCIYADKVGDIDEEHERSWVTKDDRFMQAVSTNDYWPCVVIARIKSGPQGIYTVEILQSPSHEQKEWSEQGIRRIIRKFPRELMRFRTKTRSTDHYLPGVFRQPLGLPDDMLVGKWMS
jgi:hypothetical protein